MDGVDGTPTVANRYHYASNDPLNKVDPLGLRPTDDGPEFGGGGCYGGLCFRMNLPLGGGGLDECDFDDFASLSLSQIEDPCSLFHIDAGDPAAALLGTDPATFRCWRFTIDTDVTPNIDLACRIYISRQATTAFEGLYAAAPSERGFFDTLCSTSIGGGTLGAEVDNILSAFDRLIGFPTNCVDYLMEVDGDVGNSIRAASSSGECLILNLHVKSQFDVGAPDPHSIVPGREAEVYGIEGAGTPIGSWVAAVEHWWSASVTTPFCHDS